MVAGGQLLKGPRPRSGWVAAKGGFEPLKLAFCDVTNDGFFWVINNVPNLRQLCTYFWSVLVLDT